MGRKSLRLGVALKQSKCVDIGQASWAKRTAQKLVRTCEALSGWSPLDLRRLAYLKRFLSDLQAYRKADGQDSFRLSLSHLYPILSDYADAAGTAKGHYFFQDLWVAQQIYAAKPGIHLDVGSRIDGFVAHLLTFMPVTVVDIRPLQSEIPGLTFHQADGTSLNMTYPSGVPSVSSLHAVEHFGLGRYGDPVDPSGWKKGARTLLSLLAKEGTLYFSVPIGRERLEFNAQRVFAPKTILTEFQELKLERFAAVDDSGNFHVDTSPSEFSNSNYACGIFVFRKKERR